MSCSNADFETVSLHYDEKGGEGAIREAKWSSTQVPLPSARSPSLSLIHVHHTFGNDDIHLLLAPPLPNPPISTKTVGYYQRTASL